MKIKNSVFIKNEQNKIEVTMKMRSLIRKTVAAVMEYEEQDYSAEVSVTLCDNEEIHKLNKEYRNVDRETDVLSFPLFDDIEDGKCALGDIVISLEKALSQSQEYGHSFERELAFLVAHSMLHLLGYDHETSKEDEEDMFGRQEAILGIMGITR